MKRRIKNQYAVRFISIGLLLMATCTTSWGQSNAKTVSVMAKAIKMTVNGSEKTVVALRWLPVGDTVTANSSATNYYLNAWNRYRSRNGYVIERRNVSTGVVDRTVTVLPDTAALGNCSRNNALGFESEACDILYGALFEPIETSAGVINGQPIQIELNNAQENPQRYALTALGSEMSFKASRLAGLGFVDSTAVANANYDYRIREAGATPADTATRSSQVRIQASILSDQLAPQTPKAKFGNKTVTLRWRWRDLTTTQKAFQKVYSSYHIEYSTTSATADMTRITTKPLFPFGDVSDSLYFNVPIDTDGVLRYFRVVGRTSFDEEVVSGTVSGQGVSPQPRYYARIDSSTILPTRQAYLRWVFPSDTVVANANATLKGFMVRKSTDLNLYQTLSGSGLLPATTRQFTTPNITEGTYFVITAITTSNDTLNSIPVFLQPVDESPPTVPTGLTATWQQTPKGVKLTWTANSEPDLLGYKLFRSNLANEEPSVIADSLVATTFVDTLIKLDNPKAFYYLLAYDKRYNHSALSARVQIKKPDLIAPARPVFRNFSINGNKITLNWTNSVSIDVASHRLSRKPLQTSGTGNVLKTWVSPNLGESYVDSTLTAGGTFTYLIQAIDSTNNTALDSIVIELVSAYVSKPALTVLTAALDTVFQQVELKWTYAATDVTEFQLLKAEGAAAPLGTWKTVDSFSRTIYDETITTGKTYRYAIRALFADGSVSNWKEITVTVP